MLLARLMEHFWAQFQRQLRQSHRQQLVQRLGTEAATQHQQPWSATDQGVTRGFQKQLFTYGITRGTTLCVGLERIREGFANAAGEGREATVGGTGHGVLLVDNQRHTGQLSSQSTRPSNIATQTQHAHRL